MFARMRALSIKLNMSCVYNPPPPHTLYTYILGTGFRPMRRECRWAAVGAPDKAGYPVWGFGPVTAVVSTLSPKAYSFMIGYQTQPSALAPQCLTK